jgi:hypothetical protein
VIEKKIEKLYGKSSRKFEEQEIFVFGNFLLFYFKYLSIIIHEIIIIAAIESEQINNVLVVVLGVNS